MIGTSTREYIFIRVCVLGLYSVAPICIIYTALSIGLYGTGVAYYRLPFLVECVALAETLFYFFVYLPYSYYLQREAVHPAPRTRAERRELLELCQENVANPEQYLSKWFLGAPRDEIKRENVKEFLLWAFFNRGGPPGEDDEELEEYVSLMGRQWGERIHPGRGTAKCLRLTLDGVNMMHRSLIWYFVSNCERHICCRLSANPITKVRWLRRQPNLFSTPLPRLPLPPHNGKVPLLELPLPYASPYNVLYFSC